jgi:hypothetical protein
MKECDLLKIAFILRNGSYKYMVMSFELTNAPAYLMDLMNKVFMEYLDKFIIVFIDGILVYSKSEEEYEEHLHLVLQKLRGHRLCAKLSKCMFWIKRVSFLSHIISKEGISMDLSKIRDVLSWNTPASVTNIQSFLGLVGHYSKFIDGFLKITMPMIELLEKDKKFKWTPSRGASF